MNKELSAIAKRYIENVCNQDAIMDKKQKELESSLDKIRTERSDLGKKISRFKLYKPDMGVCPICWIGDGLSANFKPIGGDGTTDNFKCTHCGYLLECES